MKGEGRIQWERYEGEGCKEDKEDKGIKDGGKEEKKAGREEKRREEGERMAFGQSKMFELQKGKNLLHAHKIVFFITFLYATFPLLSSAVKSPMSIRISDDVNTKPALLVALINKGFPMYPEKRNKIKKIIISY